MYLKKGAKLVCRRKLGGKPGDGFLVRDAGSKIILQNEGREEVAPPSGCLVSVHTALGKQYTGKIRYGGLKIEVETNLFYFLQGGDTLTVVQVAMPCTAGADIW